jgi:phosphomannomutase
VALRPSGTEPKAKMYVEVSSQPCPPGATAEVWARTCDRHPDRFDCPDCLVTHSERTGEQLREGRP